MRAGKAKTAAIVIALAVLIAAAAVVWYLLKGKVALGGEGDAGNDGLKDGISENGWFRVVFDFYPDEPAQCFVTDKEVLAEMVKYRRGDYEMYEYEPEKAGTADVYTSSHKGSGREYRVYHVTVDSSLAVTFTKESISEEDFNASAKV